MSVGKNAAVQEKIQLLSRSNGRLERLLGRLGTARDDDKFRASLDKERKVAKQLCLNVIEKLKEYPDKQNVMFGKLKDQLEKELKKQQVLLVQIEKKDKQIVTVMSTNDQDQLEDQEQAMQGLQIEFRAYDVQEISRKKEGILEIEKDLGELHETFMDLQDIVRIQGQHLVQFENNVSNARDHVHGGNEHISKAEDLDRKSRKRMCFLLLIVALVLLVTVLFITL